MTPLTALLRQVLCPVPWYNLRHQHYLPNSAHGPHGYVLSTHTKLVRASQQAMVQKGIIRYREQLYKVAETDDAPAELPGEDDADESEVQRQNELEEHELTVAASSHRSVHTHEPSIRLRLKEGKSMRLKLAYVSEELPCVEAYFEDSFNGGSCVKLNPTDRVSERHRFVRLFQSDFQCEGTLVVCLATKRLAEAPDQYLAVHMYHSLDAQGPGGADALVALVCRPLAHSPSVTEDRTTVYPENLQSSFKELQTYLLLSEPGFYVPVENSFGWDVW